MTRPQQPGNNKLPEFKNLTDRMIAETPKGPFLAIKTNLDPKDATEDNPYYQNKQSKNDKSFLDFFDE